ncbi:hypothetical protein GGR08_001699 [Bartonella fuyuanensis]|uniref:Uncharacterized protein n=1 Tax=Bartonella fuyuanensis TaxID=1460968 RepID=A0A840E5G9_9HYPH|nr:hypothetical protein [Bartonella fuyuanensis]
MKNSKNTISSSIATATASVNKQQLAKKYELTNENRVVSGVTLHRIKALRDFSDVKAGSLGGLYRK